MDQILTNKLQYIADEFSNEGIEALENLTPEILLDLESLLNHEISYMFDNGAQDDLIKIRFLFRIWVKYGTDIMRGISLLQKHQS